MLTCPHEGCQYNMRQDLHAAVDHTAARVGQLQGGWQSPGRHREAPTWLCVGTDTNKSVWETGASCISSPYRTRVAGPGKTPRHQEEE